MWIYVFLGQHLWFVDDSLTLQKKIRVFDFEQINPEKAREEFRSASQMNEGTEVKDFMDGMGLGMLVEQVVV